MLCGWFPWSTVIKRKRSRNLLLSVCRGLIVFLYMFTIFQSLYQYVLTEWQRATLDRWPVNQRANIDIQDSLPDLHVFGLCAETGSLRGN